MGGIEKSLSMVANYLDNVNVEVHFITLFPFEDFFELNAGITVYKPGLKFQSNPKNKLKNLLYYIRLLSPIGGRITKRINSIKPDLVLSYGDWFPHFIMLGLMSKYPFVYSNRSNPNIRYSKGIEFVRWCAYKLAPPTGIIAQTSYAKERKLRLLGSNIPIRIIPNPTFLIDDFPREKRNWVVSVGRLHKEKGFIRLIEAFAHVKNKDWRLIIVGDGIHREEIHKEIEQKGLEDRVILKGKSNNIVPILLQSSIFVLASHNEGFPNALLEAFATGLPSVSFDIVAGPSDIIHNGVNGILLPDNDIEGLTNSINRLIDDEELRFVLGKNAKESSEKYNIDIIGTDIHSFLNEVANKWKSHL